VIVAEEDRVSGLQPPGRSFPLHYRYRPEDFAVPAPAHQQALEVLYVVGGLYGNDLALARVLELFEAERGRKRLVFNGDFHWFDADQATFARVTPFEAMSRPNSPPKPRAMTPAAAAPIPTG